MGKNSHPIETLAALLDGSNAQPVITPSRLAPSAVYDVDYRTAIIALVFEAFSKPIGVGPERRISAAKLKLLQFVAIRPWLLPAIREWSEGLAQGSLDLIHSVRIRRGFLSDTAHEDVMNVLVASGIFLRHGSHVVTGQRADYLQQIASSIAHDGLFENEQKMIALLADVRITNNMLEGW
jgi:hypothetical protein